jgi:predicted nucleic acid-binding protein
MANQVYVIDTSVYMADAQPAEPYHAVAFGLLQRIAAKNWQIYAPTIVLAELAASIARNTGNPVLARQFVTELSLQPHIEIIAVDVLLGNLAADLAAQHRIRGCDAIYVALALRRNAVLITLDRQQRERVPTTVTARTPSEELAFLNDNTAA